MGWVHSTAERPKFPPKFRLTFSSFRLLFFLYSTAGGHWAARFAFLEPNELLASIRGSPIFLEVLILKGLQTSLRICSLQRICPLQDLRVLTLPFGIMPLPEEDPWPNQPMKN